MEDLKFDTICFIIIFMSFLYCGIIMQKEFTSTAEEASIEAYSEAEEPERKTKSYIKKLSDPFAPASFLERPKAKEPEIKWIKVCATAYTNAEGENGKWGAVDCKKGEALIDGEHIAADLSFLPYGTKVYIEGVGVRTVVDTCEHLEQVNQMAASRGCEGWIDIYMGNRNEDMNEWGVRVVNLYIIEE